MDISCHLDLRGLGFVPRHLPLFAYYEAYYEVRRKSALSLTEAMGDGAVVLRLGNRTDWTVNRGCKEGVRWS